MADEDRNVDILNEELSPEAESLLREKLETWKEEVTASLMEEVEEEKEKMIQELEEANLEYREKLKEEFAGKLLDALKEAKDVIRAEVLAETYENNPELQVLESIKELIAPTLDEDYLGNAYANELQTLREKVEELEEEAKLNEGAKTLAELVAPYSEKTQNILISLINEGGPEEVTEQFYELIKNLEGLEESDDDEDFEDEEEVIEDEDEDEEDYDDDDEEDDDEEDEEDEEADEDVEEDFDTYIKEGVEGEEEEKKAPANTLRELIKNRVR